MRPERANLSASAFVRTGIFGTATSMSSAHNLSNASASPRSCASFQTVSSRSSSRTSASCVDWAAMVAVPTNAVKTSTTNKPRERDFKGDTPTCERLSPSRRSMLDRKPSTDAPGTLRGVKQRVSHAGGSGWMENCGFRHVWSIRYTRVTSTDANFSGIRFIYLRLLRETPF